MNCFSAMALAPLSHVHVLLGSRSLVRVLFIQIVLSLVRVLFIQIVLSLVRVLFIQIVLSLVRVVFIQIVLAKVCLGRKLSSYMQCILYAFQLGVHCAMDSTAKIGCSRWLRLVAVQGQD